MKEIYLDHAATGIMRKEAIAAYNEAAYLCGNPSSLHKAGIAAKDLLESSRQTVSQAFNCRQDEVFFTSGGSESNNQAVFGLAKLRARRANRIIVTDSEHPSIENPVNSLVSSGFEVVKLSTRGGKIDISELSEALSKPTAFVCCMLANNETGALYDIAAVKKAIDRSGCGALLHCDAVQGFLKTKDASVIKKYCDTASVSAHKIGGAKGVGAIYVKKGLNLPPLILGGGQEQGFRSGTENLPGVAAFAAACKAHGDEEIGVLENLRDRTAEYLLAHGTDIRVHIAEQNVPSILSISVIGVKSEVMLNALSAEGIYVSAGSACSAARKGTSRVLEAYGLPKEELESAIRISFGAENTKEECELAAQAIIDAAKRLRR